MKVLRPAIVCCFALGLAPAVALSFDGNQAPAQATDQQMKKTLAAMKENSTEGHPDLAGQFGGILRYEKGDYAGAMKYFLVGARYADKVSQLSIGLLYLNGQGVAQDPVAAYAWIALAAERNYPQFVATRDKLGAMLNSQQRDQANEMLTQLLAEYGDAVAKPRMVAQLQQGKLHMTGSPAGFETFQASAAPSQFFAGMSAPAFGAAGLDAGDPMPQCGLGAVEGGVINGCGDYWADNRWNSKAYFSAADSQWRGTVTVSPLQKPSKNSPLATPAATQQQNNTQP